MELETKNSNKYLLVIIALVHVMSQEKSIIAKIAPSKRESYNRANIALENVSGILGRTLFEYYRRISATVVI